MILKAVIIIIAGFLLASGLSSHEPRQPSFDQPQPSVDEFRGDIPCPLIEAICPEEPEKAGKTIVFRVGIYGGPASVKPTYRWSTSAGRIVKGQGTHTIEVDTRKVKATSITGRITVGGYAQGCSSGMTARCSVQLVKH